MMSFTDKDPRICLLAYGLTVVSLAWGHESGPEYIDNFDTEMRLSAEGVLEIRHDIQFHAHGDEIRRGLFFELPDEVGPLSDFTARINDREVELDFDDGAIVVAAQEPLAVQQTHRMQVNYTAQVPLREIAGGVWEVTTPLSPNYSSMQRRESSPFEPGCGPGGALTSARFCPVAANQTARHPHSAGVGTARHERVSDRAPARRGLQVFCESGIQAIVIVPWRRRGTGRQAASAPEHEDGREHHQHHQQRRDHPAHHGRGDALHDVGGVVAVSLLEAEDLLSGRDRATRIELAGGSESNRLRATGAQATRNKDWSAVLAASAQTADELDVAGLPDATAEDQLDRDQGAFVFRVGRETGLGKIRLTLDGTQEERNSDLRALLGTGRFRNTTSLAGDDRRNQWRVLLDHHFDRIGPIARGQWRVWHQVTDTSQKTDESRPLAPTPIDLFRRFDLRETNTGLGADLETELRFAGLNHRIGYGFEAEQSDLEQQRFATQTNLQTGELTTSVLGERFPLRDFPRTDIVEAGIYLFDEIRLWQGGPTLSPGVRFEYYDLNSKPDPLFTTAFPNAEIVDLDTTAWAPRLGLVWPVIDELDFFFQFARGFRSPPFEDVNIGLDIPQFGVRAIPNPDLDAERGHTLEAGIRYRTKSTLLDLAVFRNRFKDFIDTRALVGFDPVEQVLLFQSINRDRVEIEGGELRARQHLGYGFELELAAEWTRGEDRNTNRSLAGISPPQAIAAISYAPTPDWEIRFITTATRSQRRLEDEQGDPLFSAPGSTVFDLTGRWNITPALKLNLGIFNLTDKRYWQHANVINRPPDDATLPLLAQPGTNVRATLGWQF